MASKGGIVDLTYAQRYAQGAYERSVQIFGDRGGEGKPPVRPTVFHGLVFRPFSSRGDDYAAEKFVCDVSPSLRLVIAKTSDVQPTEAGDMWKNQRFDVVAEDELPSTDPAYRGYRQEVRVLVRGRMSQADHERRNVPHQWMPDVITPTIKKKKPKSVMTGSPYAELVSSS